MCQIISQFAGGYIRSHSVQSGKMGIFSLACQDKITIIFNISMNCQSGKTETGDKMELLQLITLILYARGTVTTI